MFRHLSTLLALACLPCALPVFAANDGKPAVEHTQVKFEPYSGSIEGNSAQGIEGMLVLPLSHRWGAQFDVLGGDVDSPVGDIDLRGFALHVFRRDPDNNLFDFSIDATDVEDINLNRIAVLVEYYWGKRTLTTSAGYLFGDIPHSGFGGIALKEYLTDSFNLNFDINAVDSQTIFGAGFDYRTPLDGLYLFGQNFVGNNDFDATIVGIRFYFGGSPNSNTERDREIFLQSQLLPVFVRSSHEIEQIRMSQAPSPIPSGNGDPFSGGFCENPANFNDPECLRQ